MRSHFGSFNLRRYKFGPDIVDLADGERYIILVDTVGNSMGGRATDLKDTIIRQVSGSVVIAGTSQSRPDVQGTSEVVSS